MKSYRPWIDFVLFNACWLLTATGVRTGRPYLGPACVLLALGLHLAYSDSVLRESFFVFAVAMSGYLIDSILFYYEVLTFKAPGNTVLAPLWLFFQWGAFALLFEHTLSWLRNRLILGAGFAAVGGPISYFGAESFGILTFGDAFTSNILISALIWSLIFPAFLYMSKRLHRPHSSD